MIRSLANALLFETEFFIDERPHVSWKFTIYKDHVINLIEFHQRVVYLHGSHWCGGAPGASPSKEMVMIPPEVSMTLTTPSCASKIV